MPASSETEPTSSENPLPSGLENCILTASSEEISSLPDNSAHLLVTSPPYNTSKDSDADLGRRSYIPRSAHLSQLMIKIGFQMRGEIIWNKGPRAGRRYVGCEIKPAYVKLAEQCISEFKR